MPSAPSRNSRLTCSSLIHTLSTESSLEISIAYALSLLSYGVLASICLLSTADTVTQTTSYTFAITLSTAQALCALFHQAGDYKPTQRSLLHPLICILIGSTCIAFAPFLTTLLNGITVVVSKESWPVFPISIWPALTEEDCASARPRFSTIPLASFWLFVVFMLAFGTSNILIFEGPYIAEKVEHQSRYKAVGLWAYCQGMMRLSCHALGFILLTVSPTTSEACIWRASHGVIAIITLFACCLLKLIKPYKLTEDDLDDSSLRLPFLEVDSEVLSSQQGYWKSGMIYQDFADEGLTPSPSGINDTSSILVSPVPVATDPRKRDDVAVRRYLKRSRIELIGLCLPFLLFHIVNVGFGTFRSLIPSPIKGYESTRGRFQIALIVEFFSAFSYLGVTFLISFLVPKLALLYTSVAACFVWFGLGISLYSVAHTDVPTEQIQDFPGASLFYDCAFHLFCSGQRVALLLIALEAMHTRVRVTAFGWAYCASQAGGALGLLGAFLFYENASPSSILLTCSLIMMVFLHVLRTMTPTLSISHATLDDIDLRTAERFASGGSSDCDAQRQNSFWSPVNPHSRRPSIKSTRSRNSITNLSRMERQTIANFI